MKLIAMTVGAVLLVAACGGSGQNSITSLPAVPIDVRKAEFNSVQAAVTLAMFDNGLASITPAGAATNDMSAFPDTTWTNSLRFAAPDTAGLVLFNHDRIKDDRAVGSTDYMSDQFTRCKYLIDTSGNVSWADINGAPTNDADAADCT